MDKILNILIIALAIYLTANLFFKGENNSLKLLTNEIKVSIDNSEKVYNYTFTQNSNNEIQPSNIITK